MTKILYNISQGLPNPNSGGGNRIIQELIAGNTSNKYQNYFFSSYLRHPIQIENNNFFVEKELVRNTKQIGHWLFDNISIYRFFTSSSMYRKFYFNKIYKCFLNKSHHYNLFNLVHSHDTLSASFDSSLVSPIKILTIHSKGSFFSEIKSMFGESERGQKWISKMQKIETQNYLNSDLVTFPSKSAESFFLEDLNIDLSGRPNTEIVYNGVDISKINTILKNTTSNIFDKYNIPFNPHQLKVINVAEHVKEKNIDVLIKSIDILNKQLKKDTILINIGSGYLTSSLKKLSLDRSIDDKVFFLGNISNEDVIRFFSKCDILVMTSIKVVFDLVLLEAMAIGLAVLTSKAGGNLEIIKDGENGFFIQEIEEEYIAKVLLQIQPTKIKGNAIKTVMNFSMSSMVDKYKNIYENMIKINSK